MEEVNSQIALLHQAYCEASAYDLALLPVFERGWFEAVKLGLKPDDLKLVIKERIKGIAKGERRPASIYLRNISGSEEALAEVVQELAAIKAKMRIKVLPAGKQDALRASGRSPDVETDPAKHISHVALIADLRKAAG